MVNCYIKDYPRPQFVRADWQNLNGKWDFEFDDECTGFSRGLINGFTGTEITVPFTYETQMSGIGDETHRKCVWYSKTIKISDEKTNGTVILHFEGSDYLTTVWVNGHQAGSHKGCNSRFSFKINDFIKPGDNIIVVKCEDSMSTSQPRGKQRWAKNNYGCWYVQTTGIWKPVWLEFLPNVYLKNTKITPFLDDSSVEFEYTLSSKNNGSYAVEAEISFNGQRIALQRTSLEDMFQTVRVSVSTNTYEWNIRTWSPDAPDLYDVVFRVFEDDKKIDEVGSYFGLRKIEITDNKILLNNSPLYQRLILDQGYWPKSGLTPPSEDALIEDIDKIKQLGFNGLRKHQKIEDERFLFWCDVKGLLVWSEMAATYRYDDDAVENLTVEWLEIIRQNYNHPCIITWTPFNESWGVSKIKDKKEEQAFTVSVYHLTKAFDPYRPVVANDGWEHTCSDIITLHDYEQDADKFYDVFMPEESVLENRKSMTNGRFAFANGWEYENQPVIISEYGGIAIAGLGEGWGYGNKVENVKGLEERYDALTSAIHDMPYVSGFCYTQVTDVEQEINGLMDAERNFKCDPEAIRAVNLKKTIF